MMEKSQKEMTAEMIGSSKTSNTKIALLIMLGLLLLTNLAVFLNIPFLRQFLGFLFFTIVPGWLILYILKLDKLGLTEKFILSVGLSIAFLTLFGLLFNFIYPLLGYTTPLSTNSVTISFSVLFIVLGIISYKRGGFSFSLPDFKLDTREKTFLLLPAIFPLLSILGMRFMNAADNNTMLLALLFLIAAYVVLMTKLRHQIPEKTYPAIIFLSSISLLLMLALRSRYIIGTDVHFTHLLFQTTADQARWTVQMGSPVSAMLSVTLLPTIYQSIMNMSSEYLFKIIYPVLLSISPLVIYVIAKRYVGDFYAFLASLFFMSNGIFLWTAAHVRTNMAILFFALAVMVLFHRGMSEFNKRLLFIIFTISVIASHYATTYVFFFILLFTWAVMQISTRLTSRPKQTASTSESPAVEDTPPDSTQGVVLSKDTADSSRVATTDTPRPGIKRGISVTIVIMFFAGIFFWYGQITESPFASGVNYIYYKLSNLNQLFLADLASGSEVAAARGEDILFKEIPKQIEFVSAWLTIAFIATGVLAMATRYRKKVPILNLRRNQPSYLQSTVDTEHMVLALVCSAVLGLAFVFPFFIEGYSMGRTYFQMVAVLSPFMVIGGIVVARFLKLHSHWVLLLVLIPYFLSTTGALYSVTVVTKGLTLTAEGATYNEYYIRESEVYAAQWLGNNASPLPPNIIIYHGPFEGKRLIKAAGISLSSLKVLTQDSTATDGYIYLGYNGIAKYQDKFEGRNRLYTNGGAEIWR